MSWGRQSAGIVTCEGPTEPLQTDFYNAGASFVEPLSIDLTEIVRSLLGKEGYDRESLSWTD